MFIFYFFYFELLLKSAIVLTQSFANVDELSAKLKKLGRNIEAIGKELKNLQDIGINNISFKTGGYTIKTSDKLIYVKDFNDIRYDFIEGKIRNVPANEDSIIKDSLEGAYEILKKIKYKHFQQ